MSYNAWIEGQDFSIGLWVTNVASGFTTKSGAGTTQTAKVVYPQHFFQNSITVTCRTRDYQERDHIRGIFSKEAWGAAGGKGDISRVNFLLPYMNWNWECYFEKIPQGLKRHEVAPELELNLFVVRDLMDKGEAEVSKLDRPYWWDDPDFEKLLSSQKNAQIAFEQGREEFFKNPPQFDFPDFPSPIKLGVTENDDGNSLQGARNKDKMRQGTYNSNEQR